MKLTDLLMKVARNEILNQTDLQELQQSLGQLELVQKLSEDWVVPGTSNPKFGSMTANRIDLSIPTGNPYLVRWIETNPANMMNVATSTWTALDLTDTRLTIEQDTPCAIRLSGTKIYPNYPASFLRFSGGVLFNTNATGTRHVAAAHYNSSNVLLERRLFGANLSIGAGSGTPVVVSKFRPALSNTSSDPLQYIQMEVWQDSGITLGVGGIDLEISRMF